MHPRTHLAGSVALIAETGSTFADRIAAELAERQFKIQSIATNDPVAGEPVAAVVLVEREPSIEALRVMLDRSTAPTLVLATTRQLVAEILPLLHTTDDLTLVTEAADVIAWRLHRLIDWSRRMTYVRQQIDPLTCLPNRRSFETELHQLMEFGASGQAAGLLMVDIDRFKVINDRFGHVAGDSVLRAVGECLSRVLAPGDVVARLGGDEFGLLFVRANSEAVIRDAEGVLQQIAILELRRPNSEASDLRVTASAGLTFIRQGTREQDLMVEADSAMYEAKNSGRNRLVVHGQAADSGDRVTADWRLRHFENATRLASERLVEMIALKSRRLVEDAKKEANVCPLTGLHNRRYFDAALSGEIDRARRQGRPLSLALVDLDHFHDVNMTYGWPTGDRVLQAFANVARANVRATDWVARYGGEEFVIVMPDMLVGNALDVAERVRLAFASATVESTDGRHVAATLSAGVAQLKDSADSPAALVERASRALIRAKNTGRNRVGQEGATAVKRADEASGWPLITSIASDPPMSGVPKLVFRQRDEWQRRCNEWLAAHPEASSVGVSAIPRTLIEFIAHQVVATSVAGAHLQRDDWQERCKELFARIPGSADVDT